MLIIKEIKFKASLLNPFDVKYLLNQLNTPLFLCIFFKVSGI